MSAYTFIEYEQGTPAWLKWRNQGIGASDAPTIMGENPWKSAEQLLEEKCGDRDTDSNEAMVRGSALEPLARSLFESKIEMSMAPACLQSSSAKWMRASVDGISADATRIVEIKCGESVYRKTSLSRQVPNYYFGQLQHILAITHLELIDFWCYLPNRPEIHLVVPRNEKYIDRLLVAEQSFWAQLIKRRNR